MIRLELNCNIILTEVAKTLALSSGKIDKYCLLIKDKITEEAKFLYSTLGKAFKNKQKQLKTKREINCFFVFKRFSK